MTSPVATTRAIHATRPWLTVLAGATGLGLLALLTNIAAPTPTSP